MPIRAFAPAQLQPGAQSGAQRLRIETETRVRRRSAAVSYKPIGTLSDELKRKLD